MSKQCTPFYCKSPKAFSAFS